MTSAGIYANTTELTVEMVRRGNHDTGYRFVAQHLFVVGVSLGDMKLLRHPLRQSHVLITDRHHMAACRRLKGLQMELALAKPKNADAPIGHTRVAPSRVAVLVVAVIVSVGVPPLYSQFQAPTNDCIVNKSRVPGRQFYANWQHIGEQI